MPKKPHPVLVSMAAAQARVAEKLAAQIEADSETAMRGGVCIVQGHHHSKLNIEYLETPTVRIFGMTVGCLLDKRSLVFGYNRLQQARPILGCGVIVKGMPVAVPMWTNPDGRWTGKVSL